MSRRRNWAIGLRSAAAAARIAEASFVSARTPKTSFFMALVVPPVFFAVNRYFLLLTVVAGRARMRPMMKNTETTSKRVAKIAAKGMKRLAAAQACGDIHVTTAHTVIGTIDEVQAVYASCLTQATAKKGGK